MSDMDRWLVGAACLTAMSYAYWRLSHSRYWDMTVVEAWREWRRR